MAAIRNNVTAATLWALVIPPAQVDEYPRVAQYVPPNCTRVQQRVGERNDDVRTHRIRRARAGAHCDARTAVSADLARSLGQRRLAPSAPPNGSVRYEWWVLDTPPHRPQPTVVLLSTSDTDL